MNKIFSKMNKKNFIWGVIIVAFFAFYFIGITHESLWCDEAFSASIVEYGFSDLLKNTALDVHPPLYYLLLKIVRDIFGNSELSLKILSLAGAVGMACLGAGPVRRLFGEKTAFFYLLTLIFTPIILIMAHEVRMYSPVIFTVTACALYGLSSVRENKPGYWILFGVYTSASAYLHYYGLIAAFFINLYLFLFIILKNKELIKRYIITAGLAILSYLPWLIFFIRQAGKVGHSFWVSPVDLASVEETLFQPFFYKEFFPVNSFVYIFAAAILLLVFGMIISTHIYIKMKKEKDIFYMDLFLFMIYVSTFFTAIIISLFFAPVFYRRYIIVCTGFLILPFSIGLANIKKPVISIAAVSLFIILNFMTIKNIYLEKFNGLFHEIKNTYKDQIKSGDLIITTDCFSVSPALYYFPEADHFFYVNSFEKRYDYIFDALRQRFIKETDLSKVLAKYESFWFIKSTSILSLNPSDILKNEQGWEEVVKAKTFEHPYSKIPFTVSKYLHTGKLNHAKNGTINIKISGIKTNSTLLWITLYKNDPMGNPEKSFKNDFVKADFPEINHVFENIENGEYALVIVHDVNANNGIDIDKDGFAVYNFTIEMGPKLEFEKLKFRFSGDKLDFDMKMTYPPFNFKK